MFSISNFSDLLKCCRTKYFSHWSIFWRDMWKCFLLKIHIKWIVMPASQHNAKSYLLLLLLLNFLILQSLKIQDHFLLYVWDWKCIGITLPLNTVWFKANVLKIIKLCPLKIVNDLQFQMSDSVSNVGHRRNESKMEWESSGSCPIHRHCLVTVPLVGLTHVFPLVLKHFFFWF